MSILLVLLFMVAYNVHGLANELAFEIRRAGTAAKFIIKSSLLLMSPNL